jgi:rhomboid family GlyGly-CTERM serine protease
MKNPVLAISDSPVGQGLELSKLNSSADQRLRPKACRRPEIPVFVALILLFSAPALIGSFSPALIFQPDAVCAGEWWRLLTHPFVHVTRYHLVLDGAAFILLYKSLIEPSVRRRLAFVVAAGVGSLGVSWLAAPGIAATGLCGLSAIAHGLMAVSAVEMLAHHPRHSAEWRIGLASFLIVVGKAALEAASGQALFGFLYFGRMGDPIAVSHGGGIVGSLLALLLLRGGTVRFGQRAKRLPN